MLEAENGRQGLDILLAHHNEIAGVMLDIIMPVMDGYQFMAEIKKYDNLKNIPLIVSTGNNEESSEVKALEYGAWDFIAKPYRPQIIMFRLKNAIARSQLSALKQLQYLAEYDELTGIYNRDMFFMDTHKMLDKYPDKQFVMLKLDIRRFNLINSYFGYNIGNDLLKFIAMIVAEKARENDCYSYGRYDGDVFGLCIPYEDEEQIRRLSNEFYERFNQYPIEFEIIPRIGIYVIEDPTMSVDKIFDIAILAGKYSVNVNARFYCFYDRHMSDELEKEQEITNMMNSALEQKQFEVYFQPKCDLKTNRPCGAEALVRWKHPEKGMISPGDFIPIFERNGFISKLDYYVWEQVCKNLHQWIQEGKKPLPISVNVSRVNFFNPHLLENVINLCDKYDIPTTLFNLELTESAYIENIDIIKDVITEFQSHGFKILMDDFGSGYSSLNVLKDIDVDALKIDMKFFSDTVHHSRAANIIASIIKMVKWLNIPVVAEGVEKENQVAFLRSIGCEFVQGYYFARPMPVNEYLAYCEGTISFDIVVEQEDGTNITFRDSDMENYFRFSSQPSAILKCHGNNIRTYRVNRSYIDLFGYENMNISHYEVFDKVADESKPVLRKVFDQVITSKKSATCEYISLLPNNTEVWAHIRVHYLTKVNGEDVVFATISDISSQKEINNDIVTILKRDEEHYNNAKILVLDGTEDNFCRFTKLLPDHHFKHLTKANQLIKNNHKHEYDLIILGEEMIDMDVNSFLAFRRKRIQLAAVPIIIISNKGNADYSNNLEISDHVDPNCTAQELEAAIKDAIMFNLLFKAHYQLEAESEQRKFDEETSTYTGDSFEAIVNRNLHNYMSNAFIILRINNQKELEATLDSERLSKITNELAGLIRGTFRMTDMIAHIDNGTFVIFLEDVDINQHSITINRCNELRNRLANFRLDGLKDPLDLDFGITYADYESANYKELLSLATKDMMAEKKGAKDEKN